MVIDIEDEIADYLKKNLSITVDVDVYGHNIETKVKLYLNGEVISSDVSSDSILE